MKRVGPIFCIAIFNLEIEKKRIVRFGRIEGQSKYTGVVNSVAADTAATSINGHKLMHAHLVKANVITNECATAPRVYGGRFTLSSR